MANKKITDLSAGAIARADDLIEIVQYPGGTPTSLKVSMDELPIIRADIPPASPNALDDEFTDAATLPGGGSAIWTWSNQGTASIAISSIGRGAVLTVLSPGGVTNSLKAIEQTTPATPWEFTSKVALNAPTGTNYFTAGMFMRESGTGKCLTLSIGFDISEKVQVSRWTNSTTYNLESFNEAWYRGIAYLRIKDDGTNLIYSVSVDGLFYFPVFTESRTAFMAAGPNRIGLCGNNAHATLHSYNSFHWFRRTL